MRVLDIITIITMMIAAGSFLLGRYFQHDLFYAISVGSSAGSIILLLESLR